MSLDRGLSAECAYISGMLCDFHLLDLLSEGGTVSAHQEDKSSALIFQFNLFADYLLNVDRCKFYNGEGAERYFFAALPAMASQPCSEFTYLVPYLPVTPTFLVLFVILSVLRR